MNSFYMKRFGNYFLKRGKMYSKPWVLILIFQCLYKFYELVKLWVYRANIPVNGRDKLEAQKIKEIIENFSIALMRRTLSSCPKLKNIQ